MRTYYRSHDALVTSEHFVWRTSPPRTFRIRDLQDIGIVRADLDPARSTSAHVAGGALVLVAASWPMLDTPGAYTAAVLALALPAAAAAACWRILPRCWELRANHRGLTAVLYASSDVRAFNQVRRALMRALEDSEPPAWYELAGP